jgi:hypothetical protein
MEKAYSTNDEDYRYGDAGEALQAMADDDALHEGATYYEIDTEAVQLADYLRADRILEAAEESLYDDIGEAAEDAFAANAEAMAELSSMLSAWAEKHLSGHYWKCVGKARELKVTAADVAEYAP